MSFLCVSPCEGGVLLVMSGQAVDQSDGRRRIREAIVDGAALSRFKAMMEAQGVAKEVAAALCSTHSDYYRVLRRAEHHLELSSPAEGKRNTCRDDHFECWGHIWEGWKKLLQREGKAESAAWSWNYRI